jgi:hypothetical protein
MEKVMEPKPVDDFDIDDDLSLDDADTTLELDDSALETDIDIDVDIDDDLTADDFDIEVVDDTPEEDQGRPDDPDVLQIDTDDEASAYSAKVQKRMDKLTAKANTERRAREKLERENTEAVGVIQGLMASDKTSAAEIKTLRAQLVSGEQVYVKEVVGSLEAQLKNATDAYRNAFELGETDKLVAAQQEMISITQRVELAKQYKPPAPVEDDTEDTAAAEVTAAPVQAAKPAPDATVQAWMERNPWFEDKTTTPMRNVAMAVHTKLVDKGVHPQLDATKYYATVDREMRKRFPEYRWPDVEAKRKSNVAGPTGTNRSKRQQIKLTKSQVTLAENLGLTKEQYAAEVQKLGSRRG